MAALSNPENSMKSLFTLLLFVGLCTAHVHAQEVFHVGVEQGWWEGLLQCSVYTLAGVDAADFLNTEINVGAPAACDKVAWSMFGISMAGWNVILSALLAMVWVAAYRRSV